MHTAIDAVLQARAGVRRPASDIERSASASPRPAIRWFASPSTSAWRRARVEAQFSIPYAVAASWIDGGLGIGHFSDEGLKRADIIALARGCSPTSMLRWIATGAALFRPALVTVQFRDGETVEARVDYPKGHPRNPMTDAEFMAKTTDCATFAAPALPADTAQRLIAAVGRLDRLSEISELVRLLT